MLPGFIAETVLIQFKSLLVGTPVCFIQKAVRKTKKKVSLFEM